MKKRARNSMNLFVSAGLTVQNKWQAHASTRVLLLTMTLTTYSDSMQHSDTGRSPFVVSHGFFSIRAHKWARDLAVTLTVKDTFSKGNSLRKWSSGVGFLEGPPGVRAIVCPLERAVSLRIACAELHSD
jgi:hypothetical protein